METIELRADGELLEAARRVAASRHLSLNALIEESLRVYVQPARANGSEEAGDAGFHRLMREMDSKGVGPFPLLSREERNARR